MQQNSEKGGWQYAGQDRKGRERDDDCGGGSDHSSHIFYLGGNCIFVSLFLDMSAVKSEAMRVAGEAASSWKTDGSLVTGEYDEHALLTRNIYFLVTGSRKALTAEAEQRMTKRINERLLITRVDQSSVTINMQKVKAEAELHFCWPLRGVEKMMGQLLSFPVQQHLRWIPGKNS